jgi:hypothetical protein
MRVDMQRVVHFGARQRHDRDRALARHTRLDMPPISFFYRPISCIAPVAKARRNVDLHAIKCNRYVI